MPNWTHNTMFVDEKHQQAVFDAIKGEPQKTPVGDLCFPALGTVNAKPEKSSDGDTEENLFDFNKLIPMPDCLGEREPGTFEGICDGIVSGKDFAESEYATFGWVKEEGITSWRDLIERSGMAEGKTYEQAVEVGLQRQRNVEHYGAPDWYEWQAKNWGVKWGASATYFDKIEKPDDPFFGRTCLHFETPWGLPGPILLRLSAMFPEAEITVFWTDEDDSYQSEHSAAFKNGEMSQVTTTSSGEEELIQ